MSKTPFTAAQVRHVAERLRYAFPIGKSPLDVNVVSWIPLTVVAEDGKLVDICAALDAFAQRLEQEEAHGPIIGYVSREVVDRAKPSDWLVLPVFQAKQTYAGRIEADGGFTPAEQMREEGRREVLREIDDPVVLRRESEISGKHFECLFCHASNSTHRPDYKQVDHENDCLWRRAQEAVTP